MEAAVSRYITYIEATKKPSPHTIRAYRSDLSDFVSFQRNETGYLEDAETIVRYTSHLLDERSAALRTVRRRVASLRGFYKDLARRGEIPKSPFDTIELPLPRPKTLPRGVTRAEAAQLAKNAWYILGQTRSKKPDRQISLAVLILLEVGLRVSELVALQQRDYDPDGGALHIQGKGSKERKVFLTDERLIRALNTTYNRGSAGHLFSWHDRPWSTQHVRRKLSEFARGAGIRSHVTPHMLRHTCATLLLEDGVDVRFLQRLLGHEDIATTAIYAHVSDVGLRNALQRAGLLASIGSGGLGGVDKLVDVALGD